MPIFFNKKKREEEKARREVIARVHEKPVNRVSERNPADYTETILGEGGVISILAEDIAVYCNGGEAFRGKLKGASFGEFLSRNGVVIQAQDAYTGQRRTIVVYYSR
ncbi:MAG TPA: hypothetical protein H9671_01860 [Firmicutes bacterium]|nr:hypothetical protein [Bacillota bacterium]